MKTQDNGVKDDQMQSANETWTRANSNEVLETVDLDLGTNVMFQDIEYDGSDVPHVRPRLYAADSDPTLPPLPRQTPPQASRQSPSQVNSQPGEMISLGLEEPMPTPEVVEDL